MKTAKTIQVIVYHTFVTDDPTKTATPTELLTDRSITIKAWALLMRLLTRKDYDFIDELTVGGSDIKSEYSRKKAIKGLIEAGFLIVERISKKAFIWHVFDKSHLIKPIDATANTESK